MLICLDSGQILNLSMFEQNGNRGYVLKPNIFWDKEHPQYCRFNPSVIEREGSCTELTITVSFMRKTRASRIESSFRSYLVNI